MNGVGLPEEVNGPTHRGDPETDSDQRFGGARNVTRMGSFRPLMIDTECRGLGAVYRTPGVGLLPGPPSL